MSANDPFFSPHKYILKNVKQIPLDIFQHVLFDVQIHSVVKGKCRSSLRTLCPESPRQTSRDIVKNSIRFPLRQTFIRRLQHDLQKPLPSRTDDERSLNLGLGDDGRGGNFEGIERWKESPTMSQDSGFQSPLMEFRYLKHSLHFYIEHVLSLPPKITRFSRNLEEYQFELS